MSGAPGGIPNSPGMPNPGQPMNVTPASPHGNAGPGQGGGPGGPSMTGNPNMPHEMFSNMQGNQQLPQPSNFPPGPTQVPKGSWAKQPTTQPPSRDGPGMAQEGGWGMNNPQAGNVPGGNPQDMGSHQGQSGPGRNLRVSRGPAPPGQPPNMGPGSAGPGGMMPYPGMQNPSQMQGGPGMPPGGSPGMPTHPTHGGSGPGPYGMRMPNYPKGAPGIPGGQPKFSPYMGHENVNSPNAMGSAPNTPSTPGTMSSSNPEMFQPTGDSNGSNPSANQGGPVTRIRMNASGTQQSNQGGASSQPGAGPMDQSGPSTPTGSTGGSAKGAAQPRRPMRGSSGPIPGGPMPGPGMSPPGAPAGPLSGGPMPVPPSTGQPPQPGMPPGGYMSNRPSAEEYAKMAQMGGRPGGPGQPAPGGRPPTMYMPPGQPNGQRFMPTMGMPPGMNMGGPMPGMPKGQMSNGMEYGVSVV